MPSGLSPIIVSANDPFFTGSGSFQIAREASFFFYFTSISGALYDPTDINLTITDPNGTTAKEDTQLEKIDVGKYVYFWLIPTTIGGAATIPGKYTLQLTYTLETTTGQTTETYIEHFLVLEKSAGTLPVDVFAARRVLETLIQECQRIPVFNEIVRFDNKARTIGSLTFPMWNQIAGAKVYFNGQLTENNFVVDFLRGKISFPKGVSQYDEVTVDYNFRWFSDEQLDDFVRQGINHVNIFSPQTYYNVFTIPDIWVVAAEYAAAVTAIRSIMFSLAFQQPVKVFGGMQRAKDVFSLLEGLKKNYEEMLLKLLEQKKFLPYLGRTKTITVPEFTLPGGRSRWFRLLFSNG